MAGEDRCVCAKGAGGGAEVTIVKFARGRMSKYAQSIPAIPVLALVLYQQAGSATCLQSGLEYY